MVNDNSGLYLILTRIYLHRVIEKKTIAIGGKVKNIFDYNAIMNRHGDVNGF